MKIKFAFLLVLLLLPSLLQLAMAKSACQPLGYYLGSVTTQQAAHTLLVLFKKNNQKITGQYALVYNKTLIYGEILNFQIMAAKVGAVFRWQDARSVGQANIQWSADCQNFTGIGQFQPGWHYARWHGSKANLDEAVVKKLSAFIETESKQRQQALAYQKQQRLAWQRSIKNTRRQALPAAPTSTFPGWGNNNGSGEFDLSWGMRGTGQISGRGYGRGYGYGYGGGYPSSYSSFSHEKPLIARRENYQLYQDSPVKEVKHSPVSTFSIDVDTGAYSNARRILNHGKMPGKESIRSEEFINYFSYNYPVPATKEQPFAIYKELGPTPWNPDSILLHIGIKGYDIDRSHLARSNLVFLIDVSGSMNATNKLPLLASALRLLVNQLRPQDQLAIVVYAGASGLVLDSTTGDKKIEMITALENLTAGGSTNGGEGIRLAYAVAKKNFIEDGINRVILATDGDFNVGTTAFSELIELIEEQRKTGISLTSLGFGTGNYNDKLMEQLADVGNGHYAYIDTLQEAKKVLVDELSATLQTIAQDVKIQIEFNPNKVSEYRLIGYENRTLQQEDFNNDKVDAGEIGAGHSVTALYEIVLLGNPGIIDPLRYAPAKPSPNTAKNTELAFLKLRYKDPHSTTSKLLEETIYNTEIQAEFANTSLDFRFSAAVAAFAQQLRGGKYLHDFGYQEIEALAKKAKGDDPWGYRGELVQLIGLAQALSPIGVKRPAISQCRYVNTNAE